MPSAPPLTPKTNYIENLTPRVSQHAQIIRQLPNYNYNTKLGPSRWASNYTSVARSLQFIVIFLMIFYTWAQIAGYTPLFREDIRTELGRWWGVPANRQARGEKPIGHREMVRPTEMFLFAIIPLFIIVMSVEFLRHFNMRRHGSRLALAIALYLRQKPRIFGWVSYFSFGEICFQLFLIGGNMYVFYVQYMRRITARQEQADAKGTSVSLSAYYDIISITLAFNCLYNMAFLFIPATRNSAWMEILNISYANGVKYHRWLGVLTVITAFLHGAFMSAAWIEEGEFWEENLPCFNCPLDSNEGRHVWVNVFGWVALFAFLAIGLTSIPYVRRKLFEVFYYVHNILFVVGVFFTVLHWAPALWYMLPTLVLYLVRRSMSASNAFVPVVIQDLVALDSEITKVVVSRSALRDGDYKVGQFVYFNVPSISKLQWHPFTISSSPKSDPYSFTILLKSLGSWTSQLLEYANECKQTGNTPVVYVDGFYGTSLEIYEEYPTLCLIGGGIGVTPMTSILEDIVHQLINGSRTLTQHVYFIFSFREISLLAEYHPLLSTIRELDPEGHFFSCQFYLTRTTEDDVLNTHLNVDNIQGKSEAIQQVRQIGLEKGKNTSPMPFAEPLRSRTHRTIVICSMYIISCLILVYLQYGGGKISRDHEYLWPVQNFVEALLIFLSMGIVFMALLTERKLKQKHSTYFDETTKVGGLVGQTHRTSEQFAATPADIITYRDLLQEYNVTIGSRPNWKQTLESVAMAHDSLSTHEKFPFKNIGVFMSGPEVMKRDIEKVVADCGASKFDLHEEQFEL